MFNMHQLMYVSGVPYLSRDVTTFFLLVKLSTLDLGGISLFSLRFASFIVDVLLISRMIFPLCDDASRKKIK